MSGRGHHAAWADDNSGLDTFDVGHVFDEATRSYNLPPDAGWSERLEVERGSARVRLNKSSGFMGAIVSFRSFACSGLLSPQEYVSLVESVTLNKTCFLRVLWRDQACMRPGRHCLAGVQVAT